MTATIIDGKKIAQKIRELLKPRVKALPRAPGLGVILVGNNPASRVYVSSKQKAAQDLGIHTQEKHLPEDTGEQKLLDTIATFNRDPAIDGILVQLPLPKQISERLALDSIDIQKDVDGFSILNLGRLWAGESCIVSATPKGVLRLLLEENIPLEGKHAVIVGRSQIVGKPLAALLLAQHMSVTICHSKTKNLAEITKTADVLIAAVGKAHLIQGNMVKKDAVVIDVGINREEGKIVGDVDEASVKEIASAMTTVPGGVGPMTIAMLLENVVELAEKHQL